MMAKKTRHAPVFAVLAFLALLSGCDYRELDQMTIVAGAAVDSDEAGLAMTIELVNVESGSELLLKSEYAAAPGRSLDDAMEKLERRTTSNLYWSHAQTLVIGETFAREGIGPLVDQMRRDDRLRFTLCLIIAKDTSGAAVLKGEESPEAIHAFSLRETFKKNKNSAAVPDGVLYKYLRAAERGDIAMLPCVEMKPPETGETDENETGNVVFSGSALFLDDRLIGYLSDTETTCYNIIKGDGKGSTLLLDDGRLFLAVTRSQTQVTHGAEGRVSLEIKLSGRISEAVSGGNLLDEVYTDALKKQAENEIEAQIGALILRMDKTEADVFGFAHRAGEQPAESAEREENTPPPKIEVAVTLTLDSSGASYR